MSDRPYPKCCEELDAYQSSAAEIQDELERLRARAEAAERERDQIRAAKRAADGAFALQREKLENAEATLAAVRELAETFPGEPIRNRILAILDGEGERCPTCGGTDRDGGTVAIQGPDEFGNYDTDDCPDGWHT